jgi:iron complex transport system ATP-binding protein
MSAPLLTARDVGIAGRIPPLDLDLMPGTLTALIGPNGSGKTSLLRALAGAEADCSGAVAFAGRPRDGLTPVQRARTLAYLPPTRSLKWPIPVIDLVRLGPVEIPRRRAEAMLRATGLSTLSTRPADRLSTGELARAQFARAIAPGATLWLFDEPFANLDPHWQFRLIGALRRLKARGGAALVIVHDLSLLTSFDRALMIGDGRIAADGAPDAITTGETFRTLFSLSEAEAEIIAVGRRSSP